MSTRKLLGRNVSIGSREAVYESDDAIEIDATDQYELAHKRVLFEDVMLVTYHREIGWMYIVLHGIVVIIFLAIAAATAAWKGGLIASAIISAFAVPSIISILLRAIYQVDVISVYGRRSRAQVRFLFRKKRARELYGRICARARQIQRQIEQENGGADTLVRPPRENAADAQTHDIPRPPRDGAADAARADEGIRLSDEPAIP
jgi:hypothetical protein